jgi:hypothetical protein
MLKSYNQSKTKTQTFSSNLMSFQITKLSPQLPIIEHIVLLRINMTKLFIHLLNMKNYLINWILSAEFENISWVTDPGKSQNQNQIKITRKTIFSNKLLVQRKTRKYQ